MPATAATEKDGLTAHGDLAELMSAIETRLCSFYDLTPTMCAHHCLISSSSSTHSQTPLRAGILVQQTASDELFLGIVVNHEISARLQANPPLASLTTENLDAFCAVAEEVSHFHMISARAMQGRGVSKLELEFQGEIDKVLLAGSLIFEQSGDPHWHPLLRLIFDRSQLTTNEPHYHLANRLAGQFWYGQLRNLSSRHDPLQQSPLAALLRHQYQLSWEHKMQVMQDQQAA